jgi:hypothetical protein
VVLRRFLLLVWLWVVGCGTEEVVGSLALPESISSIPYLNRQFRKSKSIITI